MAFDLGTSVNDIAWAPYSSTVFAAVTQDGRLRLFDLNINKHEALGEVRVVGDRKAGKGPKPRLTQLAFNPKNPIICVGDDSGSIKVFKMTNNLYRMSAPRQDDLDPNEELAKLERLLILPDKNHTTDVLNALALEGSHITPIIKPPQPAGGAGGAAGGPNGAGAGAAGANGGPPGTAGGKLSLPLRGAGKDQGDKAAAGDGDKAASPRMNGAKGTASPR